GPAPAGEEAPAAQVGAVVAGGHGQRVGRVERFADPAGPGLVVAVEAPPGVPLEAHERPPRPVLPLPRDVRDVVAEDVEADPAQPEEFRPAGEPVVAARALDVRPGD